MHLVLCLPNVLCHLGFRKEVKSGVTTKVGVPWKRAMTIANNCWRETIQDPREISERQKEARHTARRRGEGTSQFQERERYYSEGKGGNG